MNLWTKTLLLISLNLFLLIGCTHHYEARLYDFTTDRLILIKAQVRGNRTTTEAILPKGEHCKGECVSVGEDDAASWGKIYFHDRFTFPSNALAAIPLSQRRVMTMDCERGTTFDCEYTLVAPSLKAEGHGACRDNGGRYYRLIFGGSE